MAQINVVRNRMGMGFALATIAPGVTEVTLMGSAIGTAEKIKKSLKIGVPQADLEEAWFNWVGHGQSVQIAFRFLNADQREFLMTGILPEEWKAAFGDEE